MVAVETSSDLSGRVGVQPLQTRVGGGGWQVIQP